jgi:hypothetical protein
MIDRKTFDITKKIKSMKDEMGYLKSAQQMSGDSWVVYRRKQEFNLTQNTNYRLTYIPADGDDTVTTVAYYLGRQLIGSIDESNTWYIRHTNPTGAYTLYVYSVKIASMELVQV